MELVSSKKMADALGLGSWYGDLIANLLMQLLQINKINKVYSTVSEKQGIEFIDSAIASLGLKYEINESELERIPRTGAFITVSNHPLGGIDGLILIKLLADIRPDYKTIGNFLLQNIEPIKEFFFPVNPPETQKSWDSSIAGLKQAMQHLQEGHPIGIFPAGEVSSHQPDNHRITDKEWQLSFIKLIRNANVPVIPIYFHGNNSKAFHLLGRIHPILRTAKLPSEIFNKKDKIIKIRIGTPIPVKEQVQFQDIDQYGRYLRAKTYLLGSQLKANSFFSHTLLKSQKKVEPVAEAKPIEIIEEEVNKIAKDYLLFKMHEFSVICAPSVHMPNILLEIGRLREVTFREVGEGTNKNIDIDEFDLYYDQLIIWDEINRKIVGAYRAGKGKDIFAQYGVKGFYLSDLFKMDQRFYPYLSQSIELGRSFIVKEYQKKPLSLFLLWKGILYILLRNPEYRYLIGPVSISNDFTKLSKSLIVEFMQTKFYDHTLAQYIKPRKKFRLPKHFTFDKDIIFMKNNTLNDLDKVLRDIQPNLRMPVLLKKYVQSLNAKIIGFNIDPKFNNCLDGFIFADIYQIPIEVVDAFSKEFHDTSILERFGFNQFANQNQTPA